MKGGLHWLVGNITGSDLSTGQTLFYLGTCYHRFPFVLYRQEEGGIDLSDEIREGQRGCVSGEQRLKINRLIRTIP